MPEPKKPCGYVAVMQDDLPWPVVRASNVLGTGPAVGPPVGPTLAERVRTMYLECRRLRDEVDSRIPIEAGDLRRAMSLAGSHLEEARLELGMALDAIGERRP